MRRALLIVAAISLVVTACGDAGSTVVTTTSTVSPSGDGPFPSDAFAVVASSDIASGPERILIGVATPSGARLASPDISLSVSVWPDDDPSATQTTDATFMWAVEGASGLYRATFDFEDPGLWNLQITPGGGEPMEPVLFTVLTSASTPEVGEPAPPSQTVTSSDAPLAEITTDTDPDPALYELSIADAVTSGRPSVIVFATPKFCSSAVCGPTLQTIRELMPQFDGVNFLHVEVFTNLDDPANLEVVPAVGEWGLPTEPWIFVVDEDGVVSGRFEGIVSAEELESVLSG